MTKYTEVVFYQLQLILTTSMFYNFHGKVSNSKDKEKLFIASNKTTPLQYVQVYFWAFKSGHMEMLKTLLLNVAIRLNNIMCLFFLPPQKKKNSLNKRLQVLNVKIYMKDMEFFDIEKISII